MPECIRTVGRARCPRVIGARDKRLSSKVLRPRQHRRWLAARVQVSPVMTRATRVTIQSSSEIYGKVSGVGVDKDELEEADSGSRLQGLNYEITFGTKSRRRSARPT